VILKKKITCIVKELDRHGRIVIPKGIWPAIEIKAGDSMEVSTDGRQIVCRKYQPGCVFCGSVNGVKDVHGVHVCRECAKEISRLKILKDSGATT